MMPAYSLDLLPLWLLFCLTIVLFYVAVEIGFRVGKAKQDRWGGPKKAQVTSVIGACLALLAFFLAFTFNMANSRFDSRKQMVLEEANAVGTTYLRAQILPEPHRANFIELLTEYVKIRAVVPGMDLKDIKKIIVRSEELHDLLWSQTVLLVEKGGITPVTALFIQSLNDVIDLHEKRVTAALRNRTPLSIWATLYFVGCLCMALMGYHAGLTGNRSLAVNLTLVLTFSAVMALIADLERPGQKFFTVSQEAMIDLDRKIGQRAGLNPD